jgi:hypothetical protein
MEFKSNQQQQQLSEDDRLHPNLLKLDSLQLTYPLCDMDLARAEKYHQNQERFNETLFGLEEQQRMHLGDRSHPRLIELDSHSFSYPGFEKDIRLAEEYHLHHDFRKFDESQFKIQLLRMRDKTQVFLGDPSHPNLVPLDQFQLRMEFKSKQQQLSQQGDRLHANLQKLDSLQLTYPLWDVDFRKAEKDHQNQERFNQRLFLLEEQQRMYLGDRSHPRLLKLDSYSFSFPGWEKEVNSAEHFHLHYEPHAYYDSHLQGMRDKQQMFLGDRSHPNLVLLDGLLLSYPNWKADFIQAEQAHQNGNAYKFKTQVKILKERQQEIQKVLLGDRWHPNLISLDELKLSYPGWQVDVEKAEKFHFSRTRLRISELDSIKVAFKRMVEGMRSKQQLVDGYNSGETKNTEDGTSIPATVPCSPQEGTCVVCMTSRSTHALVPCGHFCLCGECAVKTMNSAAQCPICRQAVQTSMKIFHA